MSPFSVPSWSGGVLRRTLFICPLKSARSHFRTWRTSWGWQWTAVMSAVALQISIYIYIDGGRPAWVWFEELLGVNPPPSQVQKFAVNCSWFQETFGECPEGADKDTVRRYARVYIMMLLGTQLFADKSGNRIHIRWLPYVARLEEMGSYSWGSAALAWFRPTGYDTCSWPLASRWSGYNPSVSEKGPRVQMWRLQIDMLQPRDFIWMPYSFPDVLHVVHPEALESRHTALWRSVMSLIYFAVIE
ncbi:protein MAIN-LIKE 1-like [Arachis hypogaea]|uniref:protein MAIN-LIKE 1-like n=1 Tax=Arachis hypogaea TaxID=3818 RepID=UPI003B2244A7